MRDHSYYRRVPAQRSGSVTRVTLRCCGDHVTTRAHDGAQGWLLTCRTAVRIVQSMGTTIKITGAVDRRDPDPTAPNDQTRAWIGMVTASWEIDRSPRRAMAAILKVQTGGGVMFAGWGPSMLCLNWIGDAPPIDIAKPVYDALLNRGPAVGEIDLSIEALTLSPDQPTYRRSPSLQVRRAG